MRLLDVLGHLTGGLSLIVVAARRVHLVTEEMISLVLQSADVAGEGER